MSIDICKNILKFWKAWDKYEPMQSPPSATFLQTHWIIKKALVLLMSNLLHGSMLWRIVVTELLPWTEVGFGSRNSMTFWKLCRICGAGEKYTWLVDLDLLGQAFHSFLSLSSFLLLSCLFYFHLFYSLLFSFLGKVNTLKGDRDKSYFNCVCLLFRLGINTNRDKNTMPPRRKNLSKHSVHYSTKDSS